MKPSRERRRISLQGFPPSVRLVGIGWYFAVCVVLFVGAGVLADKQLDSKPVLTLIGLVLGLICAFYGSYLELKDVLDEISARGKYGN